MHGFWLRKCICGGRGVPRRRGPEGKCVAEREVKEGEGTRETGKTVGLETYQFV